MNDKSWTVLVFRSICQDWDVALCTSDPQDCPFYVSGRATGAQRGELTAVRMGMETRWHIIIIIIIFTITLLILGQFCVKYPIPHQHPLPLRSHFLLELKVCHKIDLYSIIITLAQPVHVSSIWHLPLGGLVDLRPDGGGSQPWAGGLVGGQLDLLVSEQLELLLSEQPQLLISGQLELWSDNSISIRRLHTKARLSEVNL